MTVCVCVCVCVCVPRREVDTLQSKVASARERYQQTVSTAGEGRQVMSALPLFPVNDKFALNQDEAWYTLTIEVQAPIDTVMLQVGLLAG